MRVWVLRIAAVAKAGIKSFDVKCVCYEAQVVVLQRGHTELRACEEGGWLARWCRREAAEGQGTTHDLVGVVTDSHDAQPHFPVLLDSDLRARGRCQHRAGDGWPGC